MKILFVCHGAGNGGAERIITTLANEFSKLNHEIILLTTKVESNTYPLEKSVKHIVIDVHSKSILTRTIMRVNEIRSIIKKGRPDCIISFSAIPNMQVVVANFGLNTPLIISERTDPARYPESAVGKLLRNILYTRVDSIVFQTQEAMDYFNKRIRSKGTIIVNPIRNNLPTRYEGEREKRVVGIGALVPQKNWTVGLKAFKLFSSVYTDYCLEIYGEGSEREALERAIKADPQIKDNVYLRGFDTAAVERINSASMFISSSDYEGISNSMLEALATGVPTICTDCPVGGARMVIEDGINGLLVPVGDYKALSECMCRLASDKELADRLSKNATLLKERLSLDKIVKEWRNEVETVCRRKKVKKL